MSTLRSIGDRLVGGLQLGCAIGATLGASVLFWRVSDTPLDLGAYVRIDALSAFFGIAIGCAVTLAIAISGPVRAPGGWRSAVAVAALLLAMSTTLTPLIAIGYLLFALLPLAPRVESAPSRPRLSRAALASRARRGLVRAPWLLAAICLLLGYGTLAARGAMQYTGRGAGAALDSFVFWYVLLAAVISLAPFWAPAAAPASPSPPITSFDPQSLTFAWCYPLVRLYSLGPWNTGWSLAALLLGGALAGWCALAAFAQPDRSIRMLRMRASYLGLALAGLGLGTSAGIAAACFCLLATMVLGAAGSLAALDARAADPALPPPAPARPSPIVFSTWLLGGVFPFTAPFVAVWMLVGAGIAGGAALIAGLAWMVALLNGLTIAVWGGATQPARRRIVLALATLSLVLGIGAPLIARWLILPVVGQLGGGLTPYGDLAIWPWVGLAVNDAGHTQVATLPSIAIAILMLVLAALVYVVARLREAAAVDQPAPPDRSPPPDLVARLSNIRDDVPWLAVLLGNHARREEAPRERE